MFSFLIVEDFEPTLRNLKGYLEEAFSLQADAPRVIISTATSVEEGQKHLEEAFDKKKPFDAIILDFQLPHSDKGKVIDESLCLTAKKLMPYTLVAHITAFDADPKVKEHLKRTHEEQIDPRAFTLSKADKKYHKKLIDRISSFLYGKRIEQQMNSIFGTFEDFNSRERYRLKRAKPVQDRSFTHALAALCRDVEGHWRHLDERMQERIKQVFRVEVTRDSVRVSLLRSPNKT